MAKYSIKTLSEVSGIMAHTLRIWEQRYNLLSPERTDSNIRVYSDNDLKKLMRVVLLHRRGHKISHIAAMSDKELEDIAKSFMKIADNINDQTDMFINIMMNFDELEFHRVFSEMILQYGLIETCSRIIMPLAERISELWKTGSIMILHEQFLSNLIRQYLCIAIGTMNRSANPHPNSKIVAVFLPEGEHRELGIIFFSYLIFKCGHRALYLGKSIPADELIALDKQGIADAYLTSISPLSVMNVQKYLKKLCDKITDKTIYLNAMDNRIAKLEYPSQVKLITEQYYFDIIMNSGIIPKDEDTKLSAP